MQADPEGARSVFISYSRADLAEVRALAMALRRAGLQTWMDLENLLPGQRWKEAIHGALAAADAMVFCISSLSLESAWTGVEIAKARVLGVPIIPVAIEAVDLGRLPEPLRELQVQQMSLHPPRDAAALTAAGIAAALGLRLPVSARQGAPDVLDLIAVVMDGLPWSEPADLVCETLDWRSAEQICLPDLVHSAARARRAVLVAGPTTAAALAGQVLGTLCQAFGNRRVQLKLRGDAGPALTMAARAAGVALLAP